MVCSRVVYSCTHAGIPLQKIPDPLTEDDLRIISLTAFFSKVMEKFVIEWLMFFIGDLLDPKQFGGLKGNSISHYMIELMNFILYNQDYNLPWSLTNLCNIFWQKMQMDIPTFQTCTGLFLILIY